MSYMLGTPNLVSKSYKIENEYKLRIARFRFLSVTLRKFVNVNSSLAWFSMNDLTNNYWHWRLIYIYLLCRISQNSQCSDSCPVQSPWLKVQRAGCVVCGVHSNIFWVRHVVITDGLFSPWNVISINEIFISIRFSPLDWKSSSILTEETGKVECVCF